MSPSSFSRTVPRSGAALCSAGSLGLVPPLLSSYCGTPTSCSPTGLARGAFARQFRLTTEKAGPPQFLGVPRFACSGLRPRRNLPEQASGASPLRLALSMLPSDLSVSSASATKAVSGSNSTACRLAVYASCRSLPSAHARLASGWQPCLVRAGLIPAGPLTWFQSSIGSYMIHLQDEACLSAQKAGFAPYCAAQSPLPNPLEQQSRSLGRRRASGAGGARCEARASCRAAGSGWRRVPVQR